MKMGEERGVMSPLITLESTVMLLVANSTPMVDLDSKLNSFLVNLDNKFDFPTPESPINTTEKMGHMTHVCQSIK
jgi:hypothetical protein